MSEFACAQGYPAEYTTRLKELISEQGIELKCSDRLGATEGLVTSGRIVIRSGLKAGEKPSVLVYEFAHRVAEENIRSRFAGWFYLFISPAPKARFIDDLVANRPWQ